MKGTTILSDLLRILGVPHTGGYTDGRFRTMPFRTLFGFSRLLKEYGVDSTGLQLADKSQIDSLPTPFLAQVGSGFVIVENIRPGKDVTSIYYHERTTQSYEDFMNKFTGVVLLVYPSAESCEPDYKKHHVQELLRLGKRGLLLAAVLFLLTMGFIQSGIERHLSMILLFATDLAGIYVCYLLMLKSKRIKSHTADKFCGIIQKHGCDTVLEQKASSFFGLFSWSEVGMTYFTVSTLLLFLFPSQWHYLALINGCCLPFTIWSVSYQKFVIKAWCTMCLTVQTLLWCQFLCFLLGGWWHSVFPLRIELFEMGAAYLTVLLGLNVLDTHLNLNNPSDT